jgi:hypothetical protein
LVDLVTGHVMAMASFPFGAEALVWDVQLAQWDQRVETTTYLATVARNQAQQKAYLDAVARSRPAPVMVTPPAPAPAPARAPAPAVASAPALRNPWVSLRDCESDGNYNDDTGNGYYGAYQFTLGTWRSLGLGGLPSQAPPAEQDQAAQELEARRGWGQWPSCARRLGLT